VYDVLSCLAGNENETLDGMYQRLCCEILLPRWNCGGRCAFAIAWLEQLQLLIIGQNPGFGIDVDYEDYARERI
jgi:hypothetical protein